MDLVVRHELNRCIWKDTNECGRMALKKSSKAGLSIYVVTCAECTDECSWQAVQKTWLQDPSRSNEPVYF